MARRPARSRSIPRLRLDEALVARGFYASRARARDAIKRGTVAIDGVVETRPARLVDANAAITLSDAAQGYVSRAALKLKHGLDAFKISVAGRRCLDLGASTGGFTQVLLEAGAVHVTAIDVGHGQMAAAIAGDPRVTAIEGLNVRDLDASRLPGPVDLIVCDVSFISLTLALPPALRLGQELVALIKPQFEVGRAALGKGGIVTDETQRRAACERVAQFLVAEGWRVLGLTASPLAGGDGNAEYLIHARRHS